VYGKEGDRKLSEERGDLRLVFLLDVITHFLVWGHGSLHLVHNVDTHMSEVANLEEVITSLQSGVLS
jgi:hypothetical protein